MRINWKILWSLLYIPMILFLFLAHLSRVELGLFLFLLAAIYVAEDNRRRLKLIEQRLEKPAVPPSDL